MFEIGNNLKLKHGDKFYIENDIYDDMSNTLGLEPIYVYYDTRIKVTDIIVGFNKSMNDWQSFIIVSTKMGKAAINVEEAEKIFEIVEAYTDIEEFKDPNKGPNKDIREQSDPKPESNNDNKELLEFLAKKYGFDLDKEEKALDDDKKLKKYVSDLIGLAKNVEIIELDCNKCVDKKLEPCIYNTISQIIREECNLKCVMCSTLRNIDILVNNRDLADNIDNREVE